MEKRHSPGIGGWLAAVISLGVTTLALGTVLTFGWITMNDMQADMATGYTESLYELNSVVDNLDANLARAKASSSASDRVRVLSDIAIESETAETILERFPVDMQMTEQLSSFINKMGDSAKQMLYTVAKGGELTSSQKQSLQYMYETNAKIKEEINRLVSECDSKDLLNAMRGKTSVLGDSFATIQNNTFETPKGIQDGPFSDSIKKTNPLALKGAEEITAQTAEKLAKEYFADYKVSDAKCTGEAAGNALTLYNVNLTTPDGEMFVQLSKLGGKVVAFDSFKDCSDKNFSIDRCVAIAEDFLSSIGYKGVKAVWSSENGTTCNLNFAPVKGGTVLYPDLIKVKVCEERGIVTGVEALSYVLNHGARNIGKPSISEEQAKSGINGNMEISSSRTAVIPFDGEEVLCYEFIGTLDGNDYYVYVDAATGEEVEVLTVIGTKQGKALM
ncbi:MAG: germination protein YpeB, partial [Clostridia bacterium]|nr:germination protein YpeB [Clostridia bacterium]